VAEMVQRGIKLAEEERNKEEEDILYQEGVIRQLPLFGSVYNWLLPFEKPKVTGRSFNIGSQSLHTTLSPKKPIQPLTSSNENEQTPN